MSIVGKRIEKNDPRHSFAAATFRKVLKGFEIGGLPYTEVEFQLKRLLATGVSPGELREVLRRSELIQPLPEYAYREVLGLLDEAIEQGATEQSDPIGAIEQEEQLDPAALSAELLNVRGALELEQTRAREAEELLSGRIAAEEALRSRLFQVRYATGRVLHRWRHRTKRLPKCGKRWRSAMRSASLCNANTPRRSPR